MSLSALAAVALVAAPAEAQNVGAQFARNKVIDVRGRPRVGYQAIGKQVGSFTVFPKITTSVLSNDNVYARAANPASDVIGSLIAEAVAASDWTNHRLQFNAKIKRDQYSKLTKENNTSWTVGASGQLDIQRDFAATGGLKYEHLSEARSGSGVPTTTREPVQYHQVSLDLSGSKAFNRLRLDTGYALRDYRYQDAIDANGLLIDQTYRDRKTHEATAQIDYAVNPDTAVYLQIRGDWRRYFNRPLRNSDGKEIDLGVDFEPTSLVRGQVRVGYVDQSYANPAISNTSSSSFSGTVEWLATPLANLTVNFGRQVSDSGLIQSPTVLTTTAGAQVDYELLRNLIITSRIDYNSGDFSGTVAANTPPANPTGSPRPFDRNDKRTSGTLGAVYLLNRNVGLSVLYSYLDQNSAGKDKGNSFTSNQVAVSLVLQY